MFFKLTVNKRLDMKKKVAKTAVAVTEKVQAAKKTEKKVAPDAKKAEVKKAAPVAKKAAPAKKVEVKKAAPAKKAAAPVAKKAEVKKAAPVKKAAEPVKKAAVKKVEPVEHVVRHKKLRLNKKAKKYYTSLLLELRNVFTEQV